MRATTYSVTGMTCEHCVHAVREELTKIAGVADVTIQLVPSGESLVTVTSAGPLPEESLSAALDEAGDYRLSSTPA